jgi:hypothetical protein
MQENTGLLGLRKGKLLLSEHCCVLVLCTLMPFNHHNRPWERWVFFHIFGLGLSIRV